MTIYGKKKRIKNVLLEGNLDGWIKLVQKCSLLLLYIFSRDVI